MFPQLGKITPLGAVLRTVCPPYRPSGGFGVPKTGPYGASTDGSGIVDTAEDAGAIV
jgi:hypothetical protein